MPQTIKFAPIYISGNPQKSSIIEVFVAEPDPNKEFLAGRIFVLSEVVKNKKLAEKINGFLIDRINYFYYENDKILLREKLSSLKPEHIFETALSKTNKALKDFIKSEKIKNFPKSLNVTVGLIYQNEIHFCQSGSNKIFLVYKGSQAHETEDKYKLIDLSKQVGESENGLFSNILSGTTPTHGGILICNEALSEYLSTKQTTKIIGTLPPRGAAEQIKNSLEKINHFIAFGGLIIKRGKKSSPKKSPKIDTPIASSSSIQQLNTTESTTEKFLSPSGVFSIKNIIAKLFSSQKPSQLPSPIVLKDKIYSQRRMFGLSKSILSQLKTFLSFLVNAFYYLIKKAPQLSIPNISKLSHLTSGRQLLALKFEKIKTWSNRKIILLSAFALVALILIINLSLNKKEQGQTAKTENYQNLITEIEKMQNQVDANLLYSNEEGAQKLFEQINEKISSLPQETDDQVAKYNQFKDTFAKQLNDVRRITIVQNPEMIADFSNIDSAAQADSLVFHENKLYAVDSKQKAFYITDTADNTVTTLADLRITFNNLGSPTINDSSVYYFNQNSILELSTQEKKLNEISFSSELSGKEIIAIGTYSDRLYALSKTDNQVLRYNRQSNIFGSPYSWVTEKVDFINTVDMFIDGHIYVLNSNGSIIKFLRGQAQEFKFEKIEPALEAPTKISGSVEEGSLFVLEPSNNRLIIFDKKGQFIAQYQSPLFDNLKDFAINQEAGMAFLLNGNKIFKFSIIN